jgi:hypothetical protein
MTWPTCSASGLTPGLASVMSFIEMPLAWVTDQKVSPEWMVYLQGVPCWVLDGWFVWFVPQVRMSTRLGVHA